MDTGEKENETKDVAEKDKREGATDEAAEGADKKAEEEEKKDNTEDGHREESSTAADDEAKKKAEKEKAEKEKEAEEKDPMLTLEEEITCQALDVFGVEDILDLGGSGEPLFSSFAFEDWALLSLRFELHLLVHAFKRDCDDTERTGFPPEHLQFYYNRYYKKGLNPRNFGAEKVEELIQMIGDTVVICARVIESQLSPELESNGVFVMLTEECRRNRQERVDAGDEGARLKFPSRLAEMGGPTAPPSARPMMGMQANAGASPRMLWPSRPKMQIGARPTFTGRTAAPQQGQAQQQPLQPQAPQQWYGQTQRAVFGGSLRSSSPSSLAQQSPRSWMPRGGKGAAAAGYGNAGGGFPAAWRPYR